MVELTNSTTTSHSLAKIRFHWMRIFCSGRQQILPKSVGERDMERYCLHHNDIIKISSTIRLEYQRRFTASIKTNLECHFYQSWCPDRCRRCEMVLREQGGVISSAEKILESVQEDLRGLHYMIILKDERLTKDNLQDFTTYRFDVHLGHLLLTEVLK